ncbi:phage/plasmid primase, P4 family [Novosphingobium sp. SG707]|uniref:DNA primase family protein n=1 Tax=Novosphingobium sp. SG707 TaxID=2586996 RepID=UPI001446D5BA|nr:phage/plasmid primase, P4 family [Novosphingobium sp. SG707]NKI99602.1 putative DNA primase/helicase [Novosphingobium sp. SG707]
MSKAVIPVAEADPLDLAWFECNDFGNARRLVKLSGGLIRWVDDKYWLAFDGKRWSEREGQFRARALAHEVAQHVHDEVAALSELIGDPKRPDGEALVKRYGEWCTTERALDRLKLLSGHAIKSGNANQTNAMLTQAKDMEEMRAWSEDFDQDPLTYNVQNGTLRFRKGANGKWRVDFQKAHEPTDMLRQIANWEYHPKAKCPMWEERLVLVQPEAETRAIFPRMYGQSLTGLTDSEEFYIQKGKGGDGKTKTHEIIAHGHGDYYKHAAVQTFLQASIQKSGAEHRSDLVELSGDIRFVLCDEPPRGVVWDGGVLKQVTGGGTVTARAAGAPKPITFKPRWKLYVEVNPTPGMPGDDKGFRRRLRLTQWLVDLSKVEGGFESGADLKERLWSESSGILNWMIAGCLEWLEDRKVPKPQREVEALADFWATGNPLGEWLEERCDITNSDAVTPSKLLMDDFKAWMEKNEVEEDTIKKWNATRFGRELGQRQIVGKKDRRGNKVRVGIRLLNSGGLIGDPTERSTQTAPEAPADFTPNFGDDTHGDDDPFGG